MPQAGVIAHLVDKNEADVLGEVQASPTSNTLLDRLKALLTGTILAAGTANIGDVDEAPIACAAADVHAPAAAAAAVVTYAAVAGLKHVITGIAWSYSAAPTGGNLKVEDVATTIVFSVDIVASGSDVITFPKPKKGAAVNTAMIVTLAAGGAGITGKVSVLNHWTEA